MPKPTAAALDAAFRIAGPEAHATALDFGRWQEKAKTMTDAALEWSAKDAMEASRCIEGHDPARAGKYADEAMTYMDELTRRRAAR